MASQHEPEGHVSKDELDPHLIAQERLPWFGNPVIQENETQSSTDPGELEGLQGQHRGQRYNFNALPRFKKHHGSSNLEVFYDLWFVANLGIFTTGHTVNDNTNLWSYVGYITLLWFDWFLVSLYDVRYLTDSVAERIGRAVHLGVMIGFAVVSPNFTPDQQSKTTFQVTSLALALSRLSLSIRYSCIAWHVRRFKEGKWPLIAVAAINFASGWVFFGTTFRFQTGKNSRAFISWYVIIGVETFLQLILSLRFKVLSFSGTHLSERMTVSTLFMLGEGVNSLAENVVTIVQNKGWTSPTIGNLTAGISTIYIVFMIYFDWMANHSSLSDIRQALWALFHFPFHILLLLFMEGSAQLVTWWEIFEVLNWVSAKFAPIAQDFQTKIQSDPEASPTETYVQELNTTVIKIFDEYEATYSDTLYAVQDAFDSILTIPDGWWFDVNNEGPNATYYQDLLDNNVDELSNAVTNSILVNFKVDPISEIKLPENSTTTEAEFQQVVLDRSNDRFTITFKFTFISAGLTLVLLTLLFAIGRPRRSWSVSVIIRMILFGLLGIGLSLVSIAGREQENSAYRTTPWLLPTLALGLLFLAASTGTGTTSYEPDKRQPPL
ncbi:hypothetical protein ONZ43_g4180 [Nemania bipapillata]|uniref:Uncharacterized protein n=1 Tax=Nemania bipapillata TaxID=110536 RepID=A0ACC2IQR8_9PEZI|nr:hypothetical protein ONZ43_g4180 [Nemania bipapillata]